MASQNICRSALRTLRASSASSGLSQGAKRSVHTTRAPLYLDFLAPSWTISSRSTASTRHSAQAHTSRALTRRSYSTTTASPNPAADATPPPTQTGAKCIANPRHDPSGNEMTITITARAAHRLSTISSTDQNPNLALRVSVESGGCHGFQYLMSLVDAREVDAEEDTVFEQEGGEGYRPKVVMDEPSLELLSGSKIDYTMELIGSQFKVTGIPGATSSCGCGTSFDVA